MNIYSSKLLRLAVHTHIYFSKPSRLSVFVPFFLSFFLLIVHVHIQYMYMYIVHASTLEVTSCQSVLVSEVVFHWQVLCLC